jgi:hypothetical protein
MYIKLSVFVAKMIDNSHDTHHAEAVLNPKPMNQKMVADFGYPIRACRFRKIQYLKEKNPMFGEIVQSYENSSSYRCHATKIRKIINSLRSQFPHTADMTSCIGLYLPVCTTTFEWIGIDCPSLLGSSWPSSLSSRFFFSIWLF